jgi:hypothetical protein
MRMDEHSEAQAIMRYSFLRVFANDRTIDQDELDFMARLALRDGAVDAAERETLDRIFSRVSPDHVSPEVRDSIERFKRDHGWPPAG